MNENEKDTHTQTPADNQQDQNQQTQKPAAPNPDDNQQQQQKPADQVQKTDNTDGIDSLLCVRQSWTHSIHQPPLLLLLL